MQPAFSLPERIPEWASARSESTRTFYVNLVRYKVLESTNLLKEEKRHEPSDNRESCRHSTRKEIRVLLQELVVAKQAGEPLRRTRKRSSDGGSEWRNQRSNKLVKVWRDSPQSRANRPNDRLV